MPFHSPKFQQHYFPDGKPKNIKRTNFEIENRNISEIPILIHLESFVIKLNDASDFITSDHKGQKSAQVNFTSTNALISQI